MLAVHWLTESSDESMFFREGGVGAYAVLVVMETVGVREYVCVSGWVSGCVYCSREKAKY